VIFCPVRPAPEEKGMQQQPSDDPIECSAGYNVVLLTQRFTIPRGRKAAALAAVQEAIQEGITVPSGEPGGRMAFRFEREGVMLSARTLEDLLRVCGFSPRVRAGEITGLELDSETEYTQLEEMFTLLGPYVEPGYLEFVTDDDSVVPDHWRDNFTGTCHERVYPQVKWPSYAPRPLAEPALLYRLLPEQQRAFETARADRGQPPLPGGERAGAWLLDGASAALGRDDIACLEVLVGRLAGLRITFPTDLPRADREALIEAFRRVGCDVEVGVAGFLAALPGLFNHTQYRWWVAWCAEHIPLGPDERTPPGGASPATAHKAGR
jgi:hypothetical protein